MRGFTKIISLVAASTLVFCSCGSMKATADKPGFKDNEGIEIGVCFDSFVIERWEKDRDVFVDTASGLGATVNVQNANGRILYANDALHVNAAHLGKLHEMGGPRVHVCTAIDQKANALFRRDQGC